MAASSFVEHISRLSKSHIYGNRHHQKSHIKPNILLISYRSQHLALISKFVKSLLISKKKSHKISCGLIQPLTDGLRYVYISDHFCGKGIDTLCFPNIPGITNDP